jgi:hypothetical protein
MTAMMMDEFLNLQNIQHYQDLLKTVTLEPQRAVILKLLAAEEAKRARRSDSADAVPHGDLGESIGTC